ncbi:hypothetical protein [Catellatospora tritici]|uniref:hypothetical protein n=1 Tax=Catellatospora tritici TaxID=2851566 RepID=UPI001C2D5FE1|nr:hypothetical protein [Catellatospora tritici]MBV1853929.1 hypothetical protein [Catellatospora tritici]
MRSRIVLTSAVAGAVLLAGCSFGWRTGEQAGPAPATTEGAVATAEAVAKLRLGNNFTEMSFRMNLDLGDRMTAVAWMDNPRKRFESSLKASGGVTELRVIDDACYLNLGTGATSNGEPIGWFRLDLERIPADFRIDFTPGHNDPGGSDRLIDAIVSAQISGTEIGGTIDLAKIGVGSGVSVPPPKDGQWPEEAHRQPFTASLDDRGYLVRFALSVNGADVLLRYGDFFTPVQVEPPPGAIPAPDPLYSLLGVVPA